MRADHHHFVADRRIDAGHLRDHVRGVAILIVKARLQIDRELHRNLLLQQPRDQVVVLRGKDHRRDGIGACITTGHEDGAVLTDIRLERHADACIPQSFGETAACCSRVTRGAVGRSLTRSPDAGGRSARMK